MLSNVNEIFKMNFLFSTLYIKMFSFSYKTSFLLEMVKGTQIMINFNVDYFHIQTFQVSFFSSDQKKKISCRRWYLCYFSLEIISNSFISEYIVRNLCSQSQHISRRLKRFVTKNRQFSMRVVIWLKVLIELVNTIYSAYIIHVI